MTDTYAEKIDEIAQMLVSVLVNHPDSGGALHCAAALGVALAALAASAAEKNDLVFAYGVDVAISIYEKQRDETCQFSK